MSRARFVRDEAYRGAELLVLENEALAVAIVPEKGSDVVKVVHRRTGKNLLFESPMGFRRLGSVVPSTVTQDSGFTDYYEGGWQDLLPSPGLASSHRGASWGLHGETGLLAWRAELLDEGGGDREAAVRLSVSCVRYPLSVTKEVRLDATEARLSVREEVTSLAEQDVEFAWVQHIAFGGPLIGRGMHLDLRAREALAGEYRQTRLKAWTPFEWPMAPGLDGSRIDMSGEPPGSGRFEDNLYVTMAEPWYALRNSELGLTAAVSWDADVYRGIWYWLNHGAFDYPWFGRARVLGLEPTSSLTEYGLPEYVKNNTALRLPAGGSLRSTVSFAVHEGSGEVARVGPRGELELA